MKRYTARTPIESQKQLLALREELPYIKKKQRKVKTLLDISKLSYRSEPQNALAVSNDAYNLALTTSNTNDIALSLLQIGSCKHILSDYSSSNKLFLQAKAMFSSAHNLFGEGDALHKLAGIKVDLGLYSEATALCFTALKIRCQEDDPEKIADTLVVLYSAYEAAGAYDCALECIKLSLGFSERSQNVCKVGISCIDLGNIYALIGEHRIALEYFQEGLLHCKAAEDLAGQSHAQIAIGKIEEVRQLYSDAHHRYAHAKQISSSIGDKRMEAMALLGIARVLLKDRHVDSAIELSLGGMEIAKSIPHYQAQAEALAQLGRMYAVKGDTTSSLSCLHEGLELATSIGNMNIKTNILHELACSYERLRRSDKAAAFYKEYSAVLSTLLWHKKQILWTEAEDRVTASLADVLFRILSFQEIAEEFPELTVTESKIYSLLRQHLSSKEIAEQLSLSVRTVDNHRYHIRKKMGQ